MIHTGQGRSLEKGKGYTPVFLRRVPWTEEPWPAIAHGVTRVGLDLTEQLACMLIGMKK